MLASFSDVADAGVCGQQCDKMDSCTAFSFNTSRNCVLWKIVNGTVYNTESSVFFKVCRDECVRVIVRRGEGRKREAGGGDKTVSVKKWREGRPGM
jgi:hypothetical protein